MGIWEPVSHRKAVKVEKGHAAGSFRTRRSSHLAEEGMRRESGGAVQAGFVILSEMALMIILYFVFVILCYFLKEGSKNYKQ